MDWYTKQQQQQKELLLVHFHISDILDLIRCLSVYWVFAIACQVNHLPLFFHLWLNITDNISSGNTILTQYHARGIMMSHSLHAGSIIDCVFQQLRQAALQEQQEQHKARMQEKHRMRLERGEQEEQEQEEEDRSGEEVVPGDSVSNQGEVEEGTDDAKLKRLSTAERKVET